MVGPEIDREKQVCVHLEITKTEDVCILTETTQTKPGGAARVLARVRAHMRTEAAAEAGRGQTLAGSRCHA